MTRMTHKWRLVARNAIISGISLLGILAATLAPAHAFDLDAKAYIVGNADTGKIVLEKNADMPIQPASLTKMMTLYLLFDAIKRGNISMDDSLLVSEKAWRRGGSKMFVEVGSKVKVSDLIQGIAVASGNDACIVVAESMAGSTEAFAEMMNAKAKEFGMTNTTFKNPSGWPMEGHITTARDLYRLAEHLRKDFPEFYHYFSERSFTYGGIHQFNRNGLLRRNVGVDGMKTGHAEEVGFHLVASAERNGTRYTSVVLGTDSMKAREEETLKALGWAYSHYTLKHLFKKGDVVEANAPTWLGVTPTLPLVAAEDVDLLLTNQQLDNLKVEVQYPTPITAPLKKGTEIGLVRMSAPGMTAIEVPLLAGADVAEQGFFARLAEKLKAQLLL